MSTPRRPVKSNNNSTRSNKPTHIAYTVQDREGQKAYWQKIGGGWLHSDGNGLTLQLSAVPLDGRVTLRLATDKEPK